MKRREKLSRALLILAFVLVVLTAVYLHFALTPTGYSQFQERHGNAAAKINDELRRPSPSGAGDSEQPEPKPAHAAVAPLRPDPDRMLTSGLRAICNLDTAGRRVENNRGPLFSLALGRPVSLHSWPSLGLTGRLFSANLAPTDEARTYLEEAFHRELYHQGVWRSQRMAADSVTSTGLSRLGPGAEEALDQAEAFLMRDDADLPAFEDFPAHTDFHGFADIAALSVLRAARRGDVERAGELLDRFLRLLARIHWGKYPSGEDSMEKLPSLLARLGEMKAFPDEAFARAAAALDLIHADDEQLARLRAADALRLRENCAESLRHGVLPSTNGVLHFFMGGKIETALGAALQPVLDRDLERYAMALADGDVPRAIRSRRAMCKTVRAMHLVTNIGGWNAYGEHLLMDSGADRRALMPQVFRDEESPSAAEQAIAVPQRFNVQVDFARLMLAAVRFRRDHGGEQPRSIDDLIPAYLDAAFPERPGSASPAVVWARWDIMPMPGGTTTANFFPSSGAGERFFALDNQFRAEHGRAPQSPEDFRPYLKEGEEPEQFAAGFITVEATTFYIGFLRRQDTSPAPGIKIDENASPDEMIEQFIRTQPPAEQAQMREHWRNASDAEKKEAVEAMLRAARGDDFNVEIWSCWINDDRGDGETERAGP